MATNPKHPSDHEVTKAIVLNALYVALRQYQDGNLKGGNCGVGALPPDLSAVFLVVQRAFEQ